MHVSQKIGAGLFAVAYVLGLAGEIGYAWYALAAVGVITLSCAIWNEYVASTRTVSQWIQDLTDNKVTDYIVGSIIVAIATWSHFTMDIPPNAIRFEVGMMTAFWPLICGLAIHFFANKD